MNDPERTRDSYLPDPYHPGQRLYRGGDFGRWLPGGKLEYHGRRDAQVKIRGFRVEIGEVENALLRLPGVRDGAVVVTGGEDHARQLVAFCTGRRPPAGDAPLRRLGELLPAYMVPAAVHWRPALPLTANGKVDRRALGALARNPGRSDDGHRPARTPTERRLATAWARVLGVPDDGIGRQDDFFDLGGTSLSAVRLAVALDRAVSPRDLTAHPVLADLAALVDERAASPAPSPTRTPVKHHVLREPRTEERNTMLSAPFRRPATPAPLAIPESTALRTRPPGPTPTGRSCSTWSPRTARSSSRAWTCGTRPTSRRRSAGRPTGPCGRRRASHPARRAARASTRRPSGPPTSRCACTTN